MLVHAMRNTREHSLRNWLHPWDHWLRYERRRSVRNIVAIMLRNFVTLTWLALLMHTLVLMGKLNWLLHYLRHLWRDLITIWRIHIL